jgi:hypothetical protein
MFVGKFVFKDVDKTVVLFLLVELIKLEFAFDDVDKSVSSEVLRLPYLRLTSTILVELFAGLLRN